MTPSTNLPSSDELADDLIRYRLVMLPLAVEAVILSLERTRTTMEEFIVDSDDRKLLDLYHEEATELLRMLALAQSSDELERLLKARLEYREERAAVRANSRRVEALVAVEGALASMEDLPQDDERVILFKQLLAALPDIAEEAPDEVTLELLWDQKVRELGLEAIFEEE